MTLSGLALRVRRACATACIVGLFDGAVVTSPEASWHVPRLEFADIPPRDPRTAPVTWSFRTTRAIVRRMTRDVLTDADHEQLAAHGLSVANVTPQLEAYRRPPNYTRLLRPCTAGEGIQVLDEREAERLRGVHDAAIGALTAVKFVPASGAATRMFKTALQWLNRGRPLPRSEVRTAAAGDKSAAELETLLAGLPDLALWPALAECLGTRGVDPAAVLEGDDVRVVLDAMLTRRGLACAELPKALLPFHRYGDEIRTPIDEHFVEAAHYVRDARGICRLHFTVSEEHMDACRDRAERAALLYGKRFGVAYEVGFSVQQSSTDALAVDLEGTPFRDADGRLLLRPAGHGALLVNLAALDADVAFLKNIDNVVPDSRTAVVHAWKRTLGGLLVELRRTAFAHVDALEKSSATESVEHAIAFLRDELGVDVHALVDASPEKRRARAIALLDRPMRVCGIVPNTGEAGGGPFWVEDAEGTSKQIVESAQVDAGSASQQAMFRTSTHFSPVDIVCALRDRQGRPYDLARYVDENAYLIVEKSHEGRPLRSIERPGLWNGSMARWNTVFVEVPLATFAPVKTINDLLRAEHRSA